MLNLNKHTITTPKIDQDSCLATAHICVCVSLCTTVVHNTAQKSSNIFPLLFQIIIIA